MRLRCTAIRRRRLEASRTDVFPRPNYIPDAAAGSPFPTCFLFPGRMPQAPRAETATPPWPSPSPQSPQPLFPQSHTACLSRLELETRHQRAHYRTAAYPRACASSVETPPESNYPVPLPVPFHGLRPLPIAPLRGSTSRDEGRAGLRLNLRLSFMCLGARPARARPPRGGIKLALLLPTAFALAPRNLLWSLPAFPSLCSCPSLFGPHRRTWPQQMSRRLRPSPPLLSLTTSPIPMPSSRTPLPVGDTAELLTIPRPEHTWKPVRPSARGPRIPRLTARS